MSVSECGEDEADFALQDMFALLDQLQTFKTKGNIYRDCSDGVLVARLIHALAPRLVELHNYAPASSRARKLANWMLLENKVLRRLGLRLSEEALNHLADACPGELEFLLSQIQIAIKRHQGGSDERAARQAQADAEALALFGVPPHPYPPAAPPADGAGEAAGARPPKAAAAAAGPPVKGGVEGGAGEDPGGRTVVGVPLTALRRVRRDLQQKDDEIKQLMAKVQHLQRVLDLREHRIEDLQVEVQRLRHRLEPGTFPAPPSVLVLPTALHRKPL